SLPSWASANVETAKNARIAEIPFSRLIIADILNFSIKSAPIYLELQRLMKYEFMASKAIATL
ncbi:MAG: hypothetical protein QGH07_14520, partial [Alphaproteobacteria bacterium]|nr:hypothetical protein [Alphaproteobacteria bacterium]